MTFCSSKTSMTWCSKMNESSMEGASDYLYDRIREYIAENEAQIISEVDDDDLLIDELESRGWLVTKDCKPTKAKIVTDAVAEEVVQNMNSPNSELFESHQERLKESFIKIQQHFLETRR